MSPTMRVTMYNLRSEFYTRKQIDTVVILRCINEFHNFSPVRSNHYYSLCIFSSLFPPQMKLNTVPLLSCTCCEQIFLFHYRILHSKLFIGELILNPLKLVDLCWGIDCILWLLFELFSLPKILACRAFDKLEHWSSAAASEG